MENIVWIWLAAVIVFLILELASPTLVFACFVVGSLAGGIYALFDPSGYYWQIGIFVAVSVVLLPLTRKLARRITAESPSQSNVDALMNKVGLVTKPIDPDLGGQVRLDGEVWRAVSEQAIETNTKVRVVGINGNKVQVVRIIEQEKQS